MSKAMTYPEVFSCLLEGGCITPQLMRGGSIVYGVYPAGRHITEQQFAELVKSGCIFEDGRDFRLKGVAPVVRCGECVYRSERHNPYSPHLFACTFLNCQIPVRNDDFCSSGERKVSDEI